VPANKRADDKRPTLSILESTFVPDKRKVEVRNRLSRVKGQIEGVDRMLTENRPCGEILTQLAAAQEALRGASRVMVRNYLDRCVAAAIKEGRQGEVYDELMEIVFKLNR
jgi:DNA-binding FrmR family transcriptional regulator